MKIKFKNPSLHDLLHRGEVIAHPIYFTLVAAFAHGPYAAVAGLLALFTLGLLFIEE